MPHAYSAIKCAVGIALLSLIFILVFGTFYCPVREPKPYETEIILSALDGMSYDEQIRNHREYNIYRMKSSVFLDYAKRGLYADSQISNFTKMLKRNLYGNTHSESPSSELSSDMVDELRQFILKYLGTELTKYTVIFTLSEGQALKAFMESLPLNDSSIFLYSKSSNMNILGLRQYVFYGRTEMFNFDKFEIPDLDENVRNVIAFPLVDLFNGEVVGEDNIEKVLELGKKKNILSLVDASLYLTTNKLNLTETPFTAVSISFEKLFSFPKLGALILNNEMIKELQKPYFGGGTLVYALPSFDFAKLRLRPSERFEDGSLPFLSLIAVKNGFDLRKQLGEVNIYNHIQNITNKIKEKILLLKNPDGSNATILYGNNQKSILTFNFIDKDKNIKPFEKYFSNALNNNIILSSGCHLTPGTCFESLGINETYVSENIETFNISNVGALRVSVGWANNDKDVEKFDQWLHSVVKKY